MEKIDLFLILTAVLSNSILVSWMVIIEVFENIIAQKYVLHENGLSSSVKNNLLKKMDFFIFLPFSNIKSIKSDYHYFRDHGKKKCVIIKYKKKFIFTFPRRMKILWVENPDEVYDIIMKTYKKWEDGNKLLNKSGNP